jgi:hypothetical protein
MREWIIQRCTQRSTFRPELPGAACWQLEYEDFPTPEGLMTRDQMMQVLERVGRDNPNDEFRGHNTNRELRERAEEREPSADERAGMGWWNGLDEADRRHWMERSGNTGRACDAWAAYKRATN